MTGRQLELLRWLDDDAWNAPMNLGAFDGSHHSRTLRQLAAKGYADRKKIHSITCWRGVTINDVETIDGYEYDARCTCKGHCEYMRTPSGCAALRVR